MSVLTATAAAGELVAKGVAEVGGHGVVEDGIDGGVDVQSDTAEHHQPVAVTCRPRDDPVYESQPVRQTHRGE